MKITNNIINALRKAVNKLGSQTELMHLSGVNQKSLSAYLSGKNKKMTLENWLKLEPHVLPYLPVDFKQQRTQSDSVAKPEPLKEYLNNIWTSLSDKGRLKLLSLAQEILDSEKSSVASLKK